MPKHAAARPSGSRQLVKALVVVLTTSALLLAGGIAPASAAPRSVAKTPTLRYGAQSSAVKWVQHRLDVRPKSGYFGPRTLAAVKRFQRAHNLPRTGVVATRTWKALGVRPAPRAASPSARRPAPAAKRRLAPAVSAATTARDQKVLRIAARQSGKRYRYGATGPSAFDCSGMVGYVYKGVGVRLPRSSGAIRQKVRRISPASVRPGDLVFVQSHGRVSHVAIVAGRGFWYEAANPRTGVGKHKAWSRSVSYGRV